MQQAKKQLRQQIKSILMSLSTEEKLRASSQICDQVQHWLAQHPQCQTIATFANLHTEPDLSSLHQQLPHLRWGYPLANDDGTMHFHCVNDPSELQPGLHGILQPNPSIHPPIATRDIDLFLCPALAYTLSGTRLGKGGGYYDRLLADRSPSSHLLGIAFQSQIFDSLPTAPHDIPVQHIFFA